MRRPLEEERQTAVTSRDLQELSEQLTDKDLSKKNKQQKNKQQKNKQKKKKQ
jgi:hypothetical protein